MVDLYEEEDEERKKTREENRRKSLIHDGFSENEAWWYARRRIGKKDMLWLRRTRQRFLAPMTEDEREGFIAAMDVFFSDIGRVEEEGSKIYSPEFPEEREEIVGLWEEQFEMSRVPVK